MKLIAHRVNTIEQLKATPTHLGVEVDIRSFGKNLVIHHDAFIEGESFEAWLKHYRHNTLILNVKEEGLEQHLLQLMQSHGIFDFFFLDQSFPFLVKTSKAGEKRCAVRVSEFELLNTAMTLAGKVEWVWVDCFSKFPLSGEQARQLQQAGFKLCLVSPELQGRDAASSVSMLREYLEAQDIHAEAVCTKRPDLWLPQ